MAVRTNLKIVVVISVFLVGLGYARMNGAPFILRRTEKGGGGDEMKYLFFQY
jgi:hypothetical protein